MHDRIITDTLQWIDENVGERTSKDEIEKKTVNADLAPTARTALEELPDGEYDRADVKRLIQDALTAKIGAPSSTMRGFGGSM